MQTLIQGISQRLIHWQQQLTPRLMRLGQLFLINLQRFVAWFQSINWPQLPFSPLQWILILYFGAGLGYMVATPVFEASDELWHFGMVEAIGEGVLPVQDPDSEIVTAWRQEGSQPPLYYALAALVISPIDISDVDQYRELNPHARVGIPGEFGNKNIALREPGFPDLSGTALAVFILRVLGLGMGLVTIFAVFKIGQIIAPQRPIAALIAAALVGFNPMFVFISASVNNDNLVTMLNTLVIWQVVVMLHEGFNWRRSLLIAILLALGTLTKLSALVLVPVIAVAGLWLARSRSDWRGVFTLGTLMALVWLLIAGWWYYRNLMLYGELFGTHTMALVAGPRSEAFTLGTLFSEFQGFRISFWGLFGVVNVQAAIFFYALVDFLVFMSMFGVAFLVAQLYAIRDFSYARRELKGLVFLAAIVLIGLLAFVSWTAQTYATQGRLMFPFMGAIAPLLAVGFVEVMWWLIFLMSPPDRSFVRAGEAVSAGALRLSVILPMRFLGFCMIVMPVLVIAPQYAPPPVVEAVPMSAQPVFARYGDVELIAYERQDRRFLPGEAVPVTLYWRVLQQSERDNSISLTLLDPFGSELGKVDSYPGAGSLRSSTWEAGSIYADTYQILLAPDATGRYPFRLQVGWWNLPTRTFIPPLDAQNEPMQAAILDVGALVSPNWVEAAVGFTPVAQLAAENEEPPRADFGEEMRLISLDFDVQANRLSLLWEALRFIEQDYTAFVHVLDAEGELVGQADVYPELPTRYWRFGERFATEHRLNFISDLPEGTYEVIVGWYQNDGVDYPRLELPMPFAAEVTEETTLPTSLGLFSFDVLAGEDEVITSLPSAESLEATEDAIPDPAIAPLPEDENP